MAATAVVVAQACGDGSTSVQPSNRLAVTPVSLQLQRGKRATLGVTQNGQAVTGTWTTDDPKIVTVDGLGQAFAVGVGQTRIRARVGADTASAPVTVTPAQWSHKRVPAFPEASGWGAEALNRCNRGDLDVYRVTTLEDEVPGSLRDALQRRNGELGDGMAVVVFDVGGVIEIDPRILIQDQGCLYVAGQTAPGDGITLRFTDQMALWVRGNVSDLVLRYLRVRGRREAEGRASNIQINSGQRIVLDHLSLSWSREKLLIISKFLQPWSLPISGVVVQRSILSEALAVSPIAVQISGEDDDGATEWRLIKDISFHHNLLAHNSHRNPNVTTFGTSVYNNVVYNWNQGATQSTRESILDVTNNYFRAGPMTEPLFDWEVTWHCSTEGDYTPSLYVEGNVGPHTSSPGEDNWDGPGRMVACYYTTGDSVGQPLPDSFRRTNRLSLPEFAGSLHTAEQALASVAGDVGANRRLTCEGEWVEALDPVDGRILGDLQAGTGPENPIESEADVGGLPSMSGGPACPDADGDGMPDAFELRYGLNPNLADDAAYDPDYDGYVNIEEFLNGTAPWPPAG